MACMSTPTADVLALLEATFDAVVIMDDRGRIQAFNASAEEMFGYRAADALGRNVSMLMTRDRPARARRPPEALPGRRRGAHSRQGPRRARAAPRRQRVLRVPVRRTHSEHRPAAVRRLPARHHAAPQGARDARTGAPAQPALPRSRAGHAGRHRSRRRRAARQPARDPGAAEARARDRRRNPWVDSCVAPEDRAIARDGIPRAAHERRRRAAELRIPRALLGRRGPLHHLARRRAARRGRRGHRHHALGRGHHRAAARRKRGAQGARTHEQRFAPRDHGRDGRGHLARAQPAAGRDRQLLPGLRTHVAHCPRPTCPRSAARSSRSRCRRCAPARSSAASARWCATRTCAASRRTSTI